MPLQVKNLTVTLEQKAILKDISFTVARGEMIGLIGPNGSGKSTLLKALLTLLPIERGDITINGASIFTYKQKQLAKTMSYVPQDTIIGFDFLARDIVAMGRHAYSALFRSETSADKQIVQLAMERTNTLHLADQSILNLSGGQRQLVMIAKAIAQDTPLMLLDEPISALDIYYQLHILAMLKKLCEQGKTIVIVLHDLNLAARFCDKLMLLNNGMIKQYGTAEVVLTEENLYNVYNIRPRIEKDERINAITVTPFIE